METLTLPESAVVCGQSSDSADILRTDQPAADDGFAKELAADWEAAKKAAFDHAIEAALSAIQPAPDFGEPWKTANYRDGGIVTSYDQPIMEGFKLVKRAVACVNACRGMADPAKEIQAMRDKIRAMSEAIKALRRLRWIPLIERMPTEDDANDSHDVEWSNSGDIWQAHFTDSELATHWRPITLP